MIIHHTLHITGKDLSAASVLAAVVQRHLVHHHQQLLAATQFCSLLHWLQHIRAPKKHHHSRKYQFRLGLLSPQSFSSHYLFVRWVAVADESSSRDDCVDTRVLVLLD
eukprot:m.83580 g.83580  ORF g.83580 m.83580 type:complete len:108 (-) comp12724_c2_seq2:2162-2485(-)